ncbi:MAG TPA: hypothetical protein PK024_08850 [Methanospirillum sp.]|uniref:hypothetical protein n=1 Tax=Methanospirillum sp. TaxID=45200 RepID=UPI002B763CF8|nr:hypothetical protein [Methanospirillum sp.]HOJ96925.1 hypothetical protein [Methanospirillum sp.]HPP77739.1 hypothetical protein [Methanospirillum sp.]
MAYPPNPNGGGNGNGIYAGMSPPENPEVNRYWLNTSTYKLFYWEIDPVNSQNNRWVEISEYDIPDIPDIPDVSNFLTAPNVEESRLYHVIFSDGDKGTFTNGIKTNQYNQFDLHYNQIKNAIIDCGAFYD